MLKLGKLAISTGSFSIAVCHYQRVSLRPRGEHESHVWTGGLFVPVGQVVEAEAGFMGGKLLVQV